MRNQIRNPQLEIESPLFQNSIIHTIICYISRKNECVTKSEIRWQKLNPHNLYPQTVYPHNLKSQNMLRLHQLRNPQLKTTLPYCKPPIFRPTRFEPPKQMNAFPDPKSVAGECAPRRYTPILWTPRTRECVTRSEIRSWKLKLPKIGPPRIHDFVVSNLSHVAVKSNYYDWK